VDNVGFSAAEPESILLIDISDVSHAMPERVSIGNFGEVVSIGPLEVLASCNGSANDDFADLAVWEEAGVCDGADGLAGGFNDADIDLFKGSTDAGAVSGGGESSSFAEDFSGTY
jgi:hypothetical protein